MVPFQVTFVHFRVCKSSPFRVVVVDVDVVGEVDLWVDLIFRRFIASGRVRKESHRE